MAVLVAVLVVVVREFFFLVAEDDVSYLYLVDKNGLRNSKKSPEIKCFIDIIHVLRQNQILLLPQRVFNRVI
jgi:hypothetical protein